MGSQVVSTPVPKRATAPVPTLGPWKQMHVYTVKYLQLLIADRCPVKARVLDNLLSAHRAVADQLRPWIPDLLADEIRDLLTLQLKYFPDLVTALKNQSRVQLTQVEMVVWGVTDQLVATLASINPKQLTIRTLQSDWRHYHDLLQNWSRMVIQQKDTRVLRQELVHSICQLSQSINEASLMVNSDQNMYGGRGTVGVERGIGSDAIMTFFEFPVN